MSRFFRFRCVAWFYYWKLKLQGYSPKKPKRIEFFLWGYAWEVDCL